MSRHVIAKASQTAWECTQPSVACNQVSVVARCEVHVIQKKIETIFWHVAVLDQREVLELTLCEQEESVHTSRAYVWAYFACLPMLGSAALKPSRDELR